MAKDLLPFQDIISGLNGIDLLADTIRKSSGQSADQDKNTFKAIILRATDATQVNNQQLGGALGSNDVSKSNRTRGGITRSYFVRIIEDSPHAYLPDPCIQGSTQLTETANNHLIQGMHTYAIYQSAEALSTNDIVLLRLEKRDFGYDTDIGYIVGLVGQKEAAKIKAQENIGCASPSNAYKKNKISTLGEDIPREDNRKDLNGLHPEMRSVIAQLIANMKTRGYETRIISTWRSPASQLEKVNQGRSQTRFGYHNFVDSNGQPASQAVDLVDSIAGYGPDNPDDDRKAHNKAAEYFKVLGQEAKKLGLSWGGDYKKSNPLWAKHGMGWDPAHVELKGQPGLTLAAAKNIALDLGQTA